MKSRGVLRKMYVELADPIKYSLILDNEKVALNPLIGSHVIFHFEGDIFCIACGRKTNKSFAQGFCYPCFNESPEAAPCIIRPELCQAHLGIGRDMEWERKHHLQEHYVYLALSSGLKVGVTRSTQVPTRWIDQGASQAILFAKVPNRYLAGCIEVELKNHVSDRTNWQRMLKNDVVEADLLQKKGELLETLPEGLRQYVISEDEDVTTIHFPMNDYPQKIKSIGFDKTPEIEGVLKGIKGQYLYFEEGRVLNIRKHTGYFVTIELQN